MNNRKQPDILALNASARPNGNCAAVLDGILSGAQQQGCRVQRIDAGRLQIAPCRACPEPTADGRCRFAGDFQAVYEQLLSADGIVIATPVYFGSVSAQLKAIIDRFQCYWHFRQDGGGSPLPLRPGVFVCVQAAARRDFYDNAYFVVRQFFATIGVRCAYELNVTGADLAGSVRQQPEVMEHAVQTGRALAVSLSGRS